MSHEHAQVFVPDHFSRATLAKELHVESLFLRSNPGEIVADTFWTKAEASYNSNHAEFLRAHACPLLDRILKHDHLESPSLPHIVEPAPPVVVTCTPPPCPVAGVPEPSTLVLFGIGIVAAFVFLVINRVTWRPTNEF